MNFFAVTHLNRYKTNSVYLSHTSTYVC